MKNIIYKLWKFLNLSLSYEENKMYSIQFLQIKTNLKLAEFVNILH